MKEWKMEVDLVSFCAVCGKYHSALSYKSRGMGVFVFRTIMNQMYCCRSELACELLTAVLPYKPGCSSDNSKLFVVCHRSWQCS